MACKLQVKLFVAISERFRKCSWYLKALYKCPALLYFYFTLYRSMHISAKRGIAIVILFVRPSVSLSVTSVHCD